VAGTYTDTLKGGTGGCDTIARLTLTVTPLLTSSKSASVCASQLPYIWNGKPYTAAGTYTDTLKGGSAGCDTVATLILAVSPQNKITFKVEICANEVPYVWRGQSYYDAGIYDKIFAGQAGSCDTLATLMLKINPLVRDTMIVSVSVTQLPYHWQGNSYTMAGTYTDTLKNGSVGCDTIAVLKLTLVALIRDTTIASVCLNKLPYLWKGGIYNAAGSYNVMRYGNNGAPDTLAILILKVDPLLNTLTKRSVCNNQLPFIWHGRSYSVPGVYYDTLESVTGACDTAAVLDLTVNQVLYSTVQTSVCSNQLPYQWNGNVYNAEGTYSVNLIGSSGCDSVAILKLTVKPIIYSFNDVKTCSNKLPYVWNGNTYNTSGIYIDTLMSFTGCDSVATLKLTVDKTSSSITEQTICSSNLPYLWNGKEYTSAGKYDVLLVNATGCDSVATLNLKVNPVKYSTTEVTVCSNKLPFIWNGLTYAAAGQYKVTLVSSLGCDSVATLVLKVNPVTNSTTDVTVCTTQLPYIWNGQSITSSGTYTYLTVGSNGCDSVATLNLVVALLPQIKLFGYDSVCIGLKASISIGLTGTGPWSITYSDGSDIKTVTGIRASPFVLQVSPVQKTTYRFIRVTDLNCQNDSLDVSKTIHVVYPLPGKRLPTVYAYSNTPKLLNSRFLGTQYSYLWRPSNGLNSVTLADPTFNYGSGQNYLINMTSLAGCVTVDSLKVQLYDNADPSTSPDIQVPKAWTPDGDGHNDQLFPFTINIRELKYFRVFNRWGQLMFETRQIGMGWDGNFKGMPQPIDAYTWTVEGIGFDGTVIRKAGNSALLR
jgi:gliding motility-associated-like protein